MPREVSRRTSGPPEWKGGIRPDVPGLRNLDPNHVEDREDPAINIERAMEQEEAMLRGGAMDEYLKRLPAGMVEKRRR